MLFDRLGRSPDSGTSRQLIITSNRYGLTTGGYQAEYVNITQVGRDLATSNLSDRAFRTKVFQYTIEQFDVFRELYEKLKSQRIPAEDVLADELTQLGVSQRDVQSAAEIFVANARFTGLIRDLSGSERLISIEQALEELPLTADDTADPTPTDSLVEEGVELTEETTARPDPSTLTAVSGPTLHIDIQIHIDSSASADQIDQIFASMARHLYERNG